MYHVPDGGGMIGFLRRTKPEADESDTITPLQFERDVARLYEGLGFTVEMTPQSHDGGVDFYAQRATEAGNDEIIAVQCKHYSGTVGVDAARSLYGVITDQQHLTRGVLAASSTFSPECYKFTRGKRIDLLAGEQLQQLNKQTAVEQLRSELRSIVRTEVSIIAKSLTWRFTLLLAIGLIMLGTFLIAVLIMLFGS